MIYYSTEQLIEGLAYMLAAGIAVRTTADPHDLVAFVREQARQVDATVPLYNVRPLTESVQISVAGPRFFTIVLVLFATLALSTALLGFMACSPTRSSSAARNSACAGRSALEKGTSWRSSFAEPECSRPSASRSV